MGRMQPMSQEWGGNRRGVEEIGEVGPTSLERTKVESRVSWGWRAGGWACVKFTVAITASSSRSLTLT